ncbi:MAG: G10 protein-domain-containing protein [Monoraphidium minutum]|nr:MAG: G10 protein-domain-containing protein [Monoraphidium minutum]
MAALRRKLKNKRAPEGWSQIEDVIDDFEQQMKDAVNEEHEGKRKNESTWKIHRLHWEKNRFIYDLMYQRKVMNKELFDWLVREKIADGALIAKWRKPGYELLCSMLAIQKGNHNFGTTSHCRVPMNKRASQQRVTPDVQTGCICCASGWGKFGGPIWWNTPLDEDEGTGAGGGDEAQEQNRTVWGPAGGGGGGGGGPGPSRKRAAREEEEGEDEIPDEVQARLAAMRQQMGAK